MKKRKLGLMAPSAMPEPDAKAAANGNGVHANANGVHANGNGVDH